MGYKLRPECPTGTLEGLAGRPWGCGPFLSSGRPTQPAGLVSVSSRLSLPSTPQGCLEMSLLQLSGAEVTPAQQITLHVEQCLLARQGRGWGQWAGGQPQAGRELLPGPEEQRGGPKELPKWPRKGAGAGKGLLEATQQGRPPSI